MSRFPEAYPFADKGVITRHPSEVYKEIGRAAKHGLVLTDTDIDGLLAEGGYINKLRRRSFDEYIELGRYYAATGMQLYVEKVNHGSQRLYYDWEFRQKNPVEFQESYQLAMERLEDSNSAL